MTATIGSISHGTLRAEDLIETFSDELERLDTEGEYADLIEECRAWQTAGTAQELLDDLDNALNSFAPAYVRFGAHEGDGSDFGFWPMFDVIEMDAADGTLLKVADLDEVPADWDGPVAVINDHGNVTMYAPTRSWKEVWAKKV